MQNTGPCFRVLRVGMALYQEMKEESPKMVKAFEKAQRAAKKKYFLGPRKVVRLPRNLSKRLAMAMG